MDSSSKSVGGQSSWNAILSFISTIVANFAYVGQSYERFALIVYNDQQGYLVFNLNRYSTVADIQSAILQAPYLQSGTNLVNGINTALNQVYVSGVIRSGAWWTAVIVTDNLQSYTYNQQLQQALASLRAIASEVLAVGINAASLVDRNTLNAVALNANGLSYTLWLDNYSQLTSANAVLTAQRICYAGVGRWRCCGYRVTITQYENDIRVGRTAGRPLFPLQPNFVVRFSHARVTRVCARCVMGDLPQRCPLTPSACIGQISAWVGF